MLRRQSGPNRASQANEERGGLRVHVGLNDTQLGTHFRDSRQQIGFGRVLIQQMRKNSV
jgi:hypothetical protein